MDRTFGPRPLNGKPMLRAILTGYALFAAEVALSNYIFGTAFRCEPALPWHYIPALITFVLNSALVIYVTAFGRWKVIWLSPLILLLALVIIFSLSVGEGKYYADSPNGRICFTSF